MNAKTLHCLVLTLIGGIAACYQRSQGKGWWLWAIVFTLFLPVMLDGLGEASKSRGGTGLPKLQRGLLLLASAFMVGIAVIDGWRGSGWMFPAFLALTLLFFAWTAGLPDPQPVRQEPAYNPDAPPQASLEETLITGSDADFTYYMHETFPFMDWKDEAEEALSQFMPHVPGFAFDVRRDMDPTGVTFTLGDKSRTLTLTPGPEAVQLIEPLADFLAPEYVLCSYHFTEGSDTWVVPVFDVALWDRMKQRRPDRASLFTPLIDHKALSQGPQRANS